MKIRIILIIISLLSSFLIMQAQVTIGSHELPRTGTLLDLKEDGSIGKIKNSDKGFGLPRVRLASPTTLTVDDDSQKANYAGLTVYNVNSTSSGLKEGIYCWDGETWKKTIVVDQKGGSGEILKSNGDGTYGWASLSAPPSFDYHKPTQILLFKDGTHTPQSYPYSDIVDRESTMTNDESGYTRVPKVNAFNGKFVFTMPLIISSDASSEKFLLLGITANIYKNTVQDKVARIPFWESAQVEVFLNDNVIKRFERTYSTPRQGNTTFYIDVFSAIPLKQVGKGTNYQLKIKISNIENRFQANEGNEQGNFNKSNTVFYKTELKDFGLVLYENL